ncbi:MAG: type III restriction-modification system endonuclease [Gemmatimonadaceae bacterium]
MKLHFESDLPYQRAATEAVCDIFRGQEISRSEFTVTRDTDSAQQSLPFAQNELGVGNRLTLLDDELLANLSAIQLRNGLRQSTVLDSGDFTVEMETGTGKTYVYLRTIFELNKRYGFSKFVIVVPSVAIKEGTNKTLEITRDHFENLYPSGKGYEFFQYDSAKLGLVRNFATSPTVQIMVVTVGAINKFGDENEAIAEEADTARARAKTKNVMYRHQDATGGEKPIDLIRATHPVLIVDEPQSVEGGLDGKGKQAMQRMNPLCSLRYSATPKDAHHMVYKLDAVDAYEQKLVKQIEVASANIGGASNTPYVRLLSITNRKGIPTAKVELHVKSGTGVSAKELIVRDGDDLESVTDRPVYSNYRIGEIRGGPGEPIMELHLPGGHQFLKKGEARGGVDEDGLKSQMIRRTIKEHLDKELQLAPLGIKVLSLFFVDTVENYRRYGADGSPQKGKYSLMFEEEYRRLAAHPDYSSLFPDVDTQTIAEEVHDGYFSIDRQRIGGRTVDVFKDTGGNTAADEDTYNLIMKNKELLLSFDSKLKFIFSHSALREGWDNPNVFQICALREMGSEQQRRQTIGRGLRLCVNQKGERQRGFEINTLTVVASESYEEFAKGLQTEIEAETGIRFGVLEDHQFAGVVSKLGTNPQALGFEKSKTLWNHFLQLGYINGNGRVQDSLRRAILDGTVTVPAEFTDQLPQIREVLRKVAGRLIVKDADERQIVKTRPAILDGADFQALWDRIKQKTTYRVDFDGENLITACATAVKANVNIDRPHLTWRSADLAIGRAGVEAKETSVSGPVTLAEAEIPLPDVLTELQDQTQLTRRSIQRILVQSGKLEQFKLNPQKFIEQAADAINQAKRLAIIGGIKYEQEGDESYYAQELYAHDELKGYLTSMVAAKKSVYEYVVYDSEIEASFAKQLELNEAVKVYAKLPRRFTIPTPLGGYNPDWAVLVVKDGVERLYFVVETKGTLFLESLSGTEGAKIECGRAHFKALEVRENPAHYIIARTVDDLMMYG